EARHRRGDARGHAGLVLLDHGGEEILRGHALAGGRVEGEHPGPDDGEIARAAGIEQIVEIDGLLRAVETADAEMHDAGRDVGARVGRAGDGSGEGLEICGGALYRHPGALPRRSKPTPTPSLRATSPPARGRGTQAGKAPALRQWFLSPGQGERWPEGTE